MQIAPGIHQLWQRKGGRVHAFIIEDNDGLTIIDTLYDTDAHRIVDYIAKIGRSILDLKRIVLTHGHRSHIGGMAELKRRSGAAIFAHEWEADILAGMREAQRVSLVPQRPFRAYYLQVGLALGFGKHSPCHVDRILKDGDSIGSLKVFSTPGHTPGSLSFYWPDRRAMFVGDVVATWPRLEIGWKGLTLNNPLNRESLGRMSSFRDVEILAVGHGPPIIGDAGPRIQKLLASTAPRAQGLRPMSRSMFSKVAAEGFRIFNAVLPWHRLERHIGALNLMIFRDELRQYNLHGTSQLSSTDDGEITRPTNELVRSPDGAFNDLLEPGMAKTGGRFGRNFPLDQVHPDPMPDLLEPSPREVSRRLMTRDRFLPAASLNVIAAAWIQFQVHGWFDHARDKGSFRDIPLRSGDPWQENPMRIEKTVADSTRALGDGNPPAFRNQESAWWDASQIYGSRVEIQRQLRSGNDGKLTIQADGLLPIDHDPRLRDASGDGGIDLTGFNNNYWLGLSLLHTLFAKEHNAICDALKLKYPEWDDERLFGTARLVNAALMAKIHTVEWTTAILAHPALKVAMNANWHGLFGEWFRKAFGRIGNGESLSGILGSPTDHHAADYSLTEEFVSVYRMHPLIPDDYTIYAHSDGSELERLIFNDIQAFKTRSVMKRIALPDLWYSLGIANPGAIRLKNYPKALQAFDRITGERIDLATIDIVRDRERGVPRYNRFRRLLRLPELKAFGQLTDDPALATEIAEVYKGDIEKVDLMVGLMAEPLIPGFGFSETAFRIFILMASRRLKSDRFFTSEYRPEVYTTIGMDWIDSNDMSRVLLRHHPELKLALQGLKNAFAPWNQMGTKNG